MKTCQDIKNLFANVRSKQEARRIWKENEKHINELKEDGAINEGCIAFIGKHVPWKIKQNRNKNQ